MQQVPRHDLLEQGLRRRDGLRDGAAGGEQVAPAEREQPAAAQDAGGERVAAGEELLDGDLLAALDARPATSSAGLDDWWTEFDDPRLTRFVTLALAQNLDLAQASARVSSVREIGLMIFRDHAFAFEVTSILILVAMVGAVVLAKKEL